MVVKLAPVKVSLVVPPELAKLALIVVIQVVDGGFLKLATFMTNEPTLVAAVDNPTVTEFAEIVQDVTVTEDDELYI